MTQSLARGQTPLAFAASWFLPAGPSPYYANGTGSARRLVAVANRRLKEIDDEDLIRLIAALVLWHRSAAAAQEKGPPCSTGSSIPITPLW